MKRTILCLGMFFLVGPAAAFVFGFAASAPAGKIDCQVPVTNEGTLRWINDKGIVGGSGEDFSQARNSSGGVPLARTPGTWYFTTSRTGFADIKRDQTITATTMKPIILQEEACTLTVSRSGTGSGIITSYPAGINCGYDCTEEYSNDTYVILTAQTDSGSTFNSWSSGCVSEFENECAVFMSEDVSVIAIFDSDFSSTCTDDAQFVADVGAPDMVALAIWQDFTKSWKLKNSGDCDWGLGYKFAYISEDNSAQMDLKGFVAVPNTAKGAEAHIEVPMVAPPASGEHEATWQMKNANGRYFGDKVTVKIVVHRIALYAPWSLGEYRIPSSHSGDSNSEAGSYKAIDFDSPGYEDLGKPIYAAHSGTVKKISGEGCVNSPQREGCFIRIQSDEDPEFSTFYGHLQTSPETAPGLSVGDAVSAGTIIGYVGMTGDIDEPLVHFEFEYKKNPLVIGTPNGEFLIENQAIRIYQSQSTGEVMVGAPISAILPKPASAPPLNTPPGQPSNISPLAGSTITSQSLRLEASTMVDPGNTLRSAQWRIVAESRHCAQTFESRNGRFVLLDEVSTLSSLAIENVLQPNRGYWWCVRYQDSKGAWSNWSAPTNFRTAKGIPSTATNAIHEPQVSLKSTANWVLFTVNGLDVSAIQVEIYDLSGRQLHAGLTHGDTAIWNFGAVDQTTPANGVYLCIVRVMAGTGQQYMSMIRKLLILR